jgi:hypothetical protein
MLPVKAMDTATDTTVIMAVFTHTPRFSIRLRIVNPCKNGDAKKRNHDVKAGFAGRHPPPKKKALLSSGQPPGTFLPGCRPNHKQGVE